MIDRLRRALSVFGVVGLAALSLAAVYPTAYHLIQDEGTTLTKRLVMNFTGAGVSCVDNAGAGRTDCTVSGGGGGGSANVVEVSVDFGTNRSAIQTVTVTGQAWVTASSVIVCAPFATPDDGQTVENYYVTNFSAVASNRVAGTGFDLTVLNPTSAAGIYRFHCTGA